jgi:exopolyphosphatase/guanosine-5'-triphosphate,3'-diphosphate pyrophosphatase
MRPARVGVMDVGTNTTRLLVAERTPAGLTDLDRRLIFTRLGQGVDGSGRLAPDAIERTVAAITTFAGICRDLDTARVRIAGTSAVREAANREELRDAVQAAAGVPLEVLPGEEEAALSFTGATQDLGAGRYLVCDIGGGSTELALGAKRDGMTSAAVEARVSLPLGVVRMTERHIHTDPPPAAELAALEADIDATLDAAMATLAGAGDEGVTLVGVAGTVTSLSAIRLGLVSYDPKAVHGSILPAAGIDDLYRRLAGMPLARREELPALPTGRADVIVAGCAIISRIVARWSFPGVRVSEKDILDGLALGVLAALGEPGTLG